MPTVYTLFGQSGGDTIVSDASVYVLGMQFSLSQSAALTGIWWYSPATAASLPTTCVIYAVSGTSQVAGTLNNSPSWSGAAGSGWVKCSYSGSVTLLASTNYKVCVYDGNGGSGNWYPKTGNYWAGGPGGSGLTSGIITAPNNAGGDGGQDTFNGSGSVAYPASSNDASNYWVDVEVTTGLVPPPSSPGVLYSMRSFP